MYQTEEHKFYQLSIFTSELVYPFQQLTDIKVNIFEKVLVRFRLQLFFGFLCCGQVMFSRFRLAH
jgi:hypothetical protein